MVVLVAITTLLSACGRKGDLEAPGLAIVDPAQPQAPKQPADNKPFFLDPLL